MKLVRSWPAEIPEGRGYVMDDIPKLVMSGFDYRCLAELDDDIVLIEWDIAVGGEQLRTFMERAAADPDRVRAAPYLLYRRARRTGGPQIPYYVHRIRTPSERRWALPGDEYCQMFGFGLTYLPIKLVREFMTTLTTPKAQFTDSTFSRWHMMTRSGRFRDVPIDWDCHAIHLHYELPEVPRVVA